MTYRRTTRRGTRLGLILALSFCPLARDAFCNRVSKAVTTAGVPTTTQYLVDDLNPTGYPQVVDELTGPIGSAAVQRTYTYGLQRISQDQYISGAWLLSYYQYDGGGSVRQLTNSVGQVTDSYEYDAFGNSFSKQGTTPNNYLYRGEQYDSDLGLYYLRARYYNPLTGRFMSRDPEDGNEFDPKMLHKYLYAGGDPVNGRDPTGKTTTTAGASGMEYVGLAVAVTFAAVKSVPIFVAAESSIIDCINQYLRDLAICAEAYATDPEKLQRCYRAAKVKKDFCLAGGRLQ